MSYRWYISIGCLNRNFWVAVYVKLLVALGPGMAGTFFPATDLKEITRSRSRHASRHVRHARAALHVGIANPRWRGRRSRHSRRMPNPQFYVSGERPVYIYCNEDGNLYCFCCYHGNREYLVMAWGLAFAILSYSMYIMFATADVLEIKVILAATEGLFTVPANTMCHWCYYVSWTHMGLTLRVTWIRMVYLLVLS